MKSDQKYRHLRILKDYWNILRTLAFYETVKSQDELELLPLKILDSSSFPQNLRESQKHMITTN